MSRFQERYGVSLPSGNTGEVEMRKGLSAKLHGYGGTLMNIHQANRIADAESEASQADPRSGELQNNHTVYGRAYNEVLIKSNQAAIKSDYSLALEQFAKEHPGDPAAFAEKANAARSGLLANALPQVRQMAEIGYDNISGSYLNQIKANHKKATLAAARAETNQAVERAIADIGMLTRNSDDAAAEAEMAGLENLLMLSDYTPEEQSNILRKARQTMFEQAYLDDFEKMAPEAALKELEKLSQEVPEGYSPDEWDSFVGAVQTQISKRATRLAETKMTLTRDQSRQLSNLEVMINTGQGDLEQHRLAVEAAFDQGWITPAKRTELMTKIGKTGIDAFEQMKTFDKIAARINGDKSIYDIDPKDWDQYYVKTYKDSPIPVKAFVVEQMGVIPKTMKAEILNGLNSGDPEMTFAAADLLDRVDGTRGVMDTFTDQQIALADQIMAFQYLEPAEAVNKALQITDPNNTAQVEGRRRLLSQKKPKDREAAYHAQIVDNFEGINEIVAGRLATEYQETYEGLVVAGMNEEAAAERTVKRFQAVWQRSALTGQWMKYPPDLFYAPDAVAYTQDRMLNEVKNHIRDTMPDMDGESITLADIVLTDDDQTAADASNQKPTYLMWLNTPKGFVLLDRRWSPPYAQMANYTNTKRARNKRDAEQKRQQALQQKQWRETVNEKIDSVPANERVKGNAIYQ